MFKKEFGKKLNEQHNGNFDSLRSKIQEPQGASVTRKPNRGLLFGIPAGALLVAASVTAIVIASTNPKPFSPSDAALTQPKKPINENADKLSENYVKSVVDFASEFAAANLTTEDNGIASPLSIATCFSMAYEGAEGDTKQELASFLHYDASLAGDAHLSEIKNMLLKTSLEKVDEESGHLLAKLDVAQSYFVDSFYKEAMKQEYLDTLENTYFAEAYAGRLKSDEMHALLADWINEKTHGLLDKTADDFKDAAGVLWLLNSTYMKANWWNTFYSTKGERPFTNASGALEQSIYIGNFFRGLYVDEFEDYKVVPLGLYGGLTFNVLVPEEGISYESLLGNEQCYRDLISRQGNKKEYNVHVEMPEFEAKASYNLKKYAISKGVVSPFVPYAADFSSMAYVAKEDELYIAKAIHEAGIGVDKTGIEAAAYTKIEVEFVPVSYEENPRLDVILNRPFIYSITDRNGLPLFIGNVNSVV